MPYKIQEYLHYMGHSSVVPHPQIVDTDDNVFTNKETY